MSTNNKVGFSAGLRPSGKAKLNAPPSEGERRFNFYDLDGNYLTTIRAASEAEARQIFEQRLRNDTEP